MQSIYPRTRLRPFCLIGFAVTWLVTATSQPARCQTAVYQINCGGGAVSPFVADEYFSGGTGVNEGGSIDTSGAINPAPQAVYGSFRYQVNGSFSYVLPSLTPGAAYTVRFHFADLFSDPPGYNLINFSSNGTTVRSNYDIDAAAGLNSNNQYGNKAVIVAANTTADSSGNLTLNFSSASTGNVNAICNGIEVLTGTLPVITSAPTGLSATAGDTQIALSWSAVSGSSGYNLLRSTSSSGPFVRLNSSTITGTSYTDTGLTNGLTYYYEVLAVNGEGEGPASASVWAIPKGSTDFQINCGGLAIGTWIADQYFSGGTGVNEGGSIDTSGAINPAPQAVYGSFRYQVNGSFSYVLPSLTPGAAYTVRFHFADLFSDPPGYNLINFSSNGTTVRSNYDIDAAAGLNSNNQYGNKAVIVAANTTADSSGNLTLNFSSASTGNVNAICNGIEVLTGTLPVITSAPAGLNATSNSNGTMMSWKAVSGAVGYNILRSTSIGGAFVRINASTITGTSYTDSSAAPGSNYEVLAVNNYGEGPPSAPLVVFALSVNSASLNVTRGSSVSATVTTLNAWGPTPITFSVSAPAGITAWCFPNTGSIAYPVPTPTPSAPLDYPNVVLNIVVGSSVAPGNYNVTVTGKSTYYTTSVTVPIKVN